MATGLDIRRWATDEEIQAYLLSRQLTNATSIDPLTEAAYTAEDFASAVLRGIDYIDLRFYNNFRAEFKYEPANAPDEFCKNMAEATARAVSLELATPHIFEATATPAADRVLNKAGTLGWDVGKHADNSARVRNTQTQNSAIGCLLDKYLFAPVDPVNQTDTCPARRASPIRQLVVGGGR